MSPFLPEGVWMLKAFTFSSLGFGGIRTMLGLVYEGLHGQGSPLFLTLLSRKTHTRAALSF